MKLDVTYFRAPRPGPESVMEALLVEHLPETFPCNDYPRWTAGSLPIGAGMPDLLIISCDPKVFALTELSLPHKHVLSYLKAVGCARAETIVERTGVARSRVMRCLDILSETGAVTVDRGVFSMASVWRNILPEIISVEVKIQDWRKAIDQAVRNSVFAHRSYVALPYRVTQRIMSDHALKSFGIGLLGVDKDGSVSVVRAPRRRTPRIWQYYYELACRTAEFGKV